MSTLLARIGRHRQRYDQDRLRLVAGCIPYRFEKNVENESCSMENKILVLMITTPNRDDLVFPKGGWEDDETVHEAAYREALEEAGVKGLLDENPIGVWEFRSKSRQASGSQEGGCRGYMFALEVTEELESWPEQDKYERKWLYAEEAFKFCRYDWMRDALKRFLKALTKDGTQQEARETMMMMAELPTIPVSDIGTGTGCQTLSPPGCSGKSSGVQNLEEPCTKRFLKALTKDGTQQEARETMTMMAELPTIPVSDIGTGTGRQTLSPPSCSGKSSGVQNLEESCTKCIVQG